MASVEYTPTSKPSTPGAWINHLEGRLSTQRARSDVYVRYYDGTARDLAFAQQKFKEVFGALGYGWQDNFSRLIIDSISERLNILGFRFGDSEANDADAQKIWQRNNLDADSNAAHIDSLIRGHSYLVVWGDEDGQPIIQPEPASQVAVQYLAGSRRTLEAALKQYTDDWGTCFSTLWTPDYVIPATKNAAGGWDYAEEDKRDNPLGKVPVVPLSNRSRLVVSGHGQGSDDFSSLSELAGLTKIQDAINKVSFDALVASEFAAFPQRIITGLEFDSEDEEREAMIRAYVDRVLTPSGDADSVKWGTFEAADLGNYVKLIDMLVQHMASQSRVPFHYFLLNGGQAPSGDAVTAAEAGLVAKAKERMLHFGEAWEEAMRMAFLVLDDPRAEAFDAQTQWADAEHRSYGALTDALLKQGDMGVPQKVRQKKAGYTDQEIAQFPQMLEDELEWDIKKAKATAAITGAQGGSAPAGNGTSAKQQNKTPDASTARQLAKSA